MKVTLQRCKWYGLLYTCMPCTSDRSINWQGPITKKTFSLMIKKIQKKHALDRAATYIRDKVVSLFQRWKLNYSILIWSFSLINSYLSTIWKYRYNAKVYVKTWELCQQRENYIVVHVEARIDVFMFRLVTVFLCLVNRFATPHRGRPNSVLEWPLNLRCYTWSVNEPLILSTRHLLA